MGFIMGRGQGTDEVLDKLFDAFFRKIKQTSAAHKQHFAPGKRLCQAAQRMALLPGNPQHARQWVKWLLWLSDFPQHEVIRLFLSNALAAEQPCILEWYEDPGATAGTPPVVLTSSTTLQNGQKVGLLTVITCNASAVPDNPCEV